MIFLFIFGLFVPRIVIVLLWLFSNWFFHPFSSWIIPVLGFVFLPYTLLWYSVVINWFHGTWGLWQILILIVAIIADLSSSGKSMRGS